MVKFDVNNMNNNDDMNKNVDELKAWGSSVVADMIERTDDTGRVVIDGWYYDDDFDLDNGLEMKSYYVLKMDWPEVDGKIIAKEIGDKFSELLDDITIREHDVSWGFVDADDLYEKTYIQYNLHIRAMRLAKLIRLGAPLCVLQHESMEWIQAWTINKYGKIIEMHTVPADE